MENHHKPSCSSTDTFSFPSTPSPDPQDSEFEFESLTPTSPNTDPHHNSPADHLFFNGKLLPHSFPLQQSREQNVTDTNLFIPRTASRNSSISSSRKDSFVSSRSNSSNSSSARTSSSSSSCYGDQYYYVSPGKAPMASKAVMAQLYGSSQRWQHITPVPTLRRDDSRRSSAGNSVKEGINKKKKCDKRKKERSGMCWRFFLWIVMACKVCHGMETSVKDDILDKH